MASTLTFAFHNVMANRIANLITGDIEKIERMAFGTKTPWQTRYTRPFKAHYANDLAKRAANNPAAVARIMEALPGYEERAEKYMADPNRKGRPLTTFINVETPQINADEVKADEVEAVLAADLRAIIEDSIPVPRKSQPIPQAPQAQAQAEDAPAIDLNDDQAAALKALLDALKPAPVNAGLSVEDLERVRVIAQDTAKAECKRAIMPTIVHIKPGEDKPVVDMGVQHKQFPLLVQAMQCRFPIWLPGPAGSGKTTAARNAATALSIPFHHTGAVDNVYQLLGFIDAGGTYHPTEFRRAYEDGGVFLWDEVDASNAAALVAFNAALENGHCAFPDKVVEKHADCYFVAAANTYGTGATHEYVGRTKIDAATVDRFVMIDWQYDEVLERAIAGDNEWTTYVQKMRRAAKAAGVKHLITPRASMRGNALLAAGIDKETVIDMTVRKGLSDDQWGVIKSRAY